MQQDLTDRTPISLRIYLHVIPGMTFEAGVSAGRRDQPKLSACGPEVAVDVWRVDVAIETELAKGWRLLDHIEGEPPRCVPYGYRLDECAGGEFTPPNRAPPASRARGANGIRDACSEIPCRPLTNLVELNDPVPDDIRRSRDIDARDDFVCWRGRRNPFHQSPGR